MERNSECTFWLIWGRGGALESCSQGIPGQNLLETESSSFCGERACAGLSRGQGRTLGGTQEFREERVGLAPRDWLGFSTASLTCL